ncbi:hypothetical protein NliqN6_2954 [Naganishia liquefaciens]|uniref:Cytochrome P450 n=1 Tax=Naganishia liquefaciens TaxID=104408 RepID=A0A8H3TSU9_9TREE|nr:hypothetical protein NliqN6_2954 [Naganishia liquefaciens]
MGSALSLTSRANLWLTAALLAASWLIYRALLFRKSVQRIGDHPGFRSLLSDMNIIAYLIPSGIPYVNDHIGWQWREKRLRNKRLDTSLVSSVSFIDNRITYTVSSPEACRILNGDRRKFQKPVKAYEILKVFGSNIVVTEGEEWRRHRKIVVPGFSEKVFELVWNTSSWITFELFKSEGWSALAPGRGMDVLNIPELTLRVTLAVLSTASFGAPLSWKQDPQASRPAGHEMSFVEAISEVSENIFWLLAMPKFVYKLPIPKIQRIGLADRELRSYMHSMIQTRREEIKNGEYSAKDDLFNALVSASMKEESEGKGGGGGLTDDELVGNTFIMALAGHETSSHTLAFAIAYLALDPEKQAWLFEELSEVYPPSHVSTYADFSRLPRTLAVIYETLRLHPAVVYIPKYATEDTWLPDDPDVDSEGRGRRVFVPKGTQCGIDTVGLHRHPRHWKDPDSFRPERFLQDYNRDAFAPFSAGARACIGRKFAEVEMVAVLSLLVRTYQIIPLGTPDPSDIETGADYTASSHEPTLPDLLTEKLLETKPGVTLTPREIGVRLVKRRGGDVWRTEDE